MKQIVHNTVISLGHDANSSQHSDFSPFLAGSCRSQKTGVCGSACARLSCCCSRTISTLAFWYRQVLLGVGERRAEGLFLVAFTRCGRKFDVSSCRGILFAMTNCKHAFCTMDSVNHLAVFFGCNKSSASFVLKLQPWDLKLPC